MNSDTRRTPRIALVVSRVEIQFCKDVTDGGLREKDAKTGVFFDS